MKSRLYIIDISGYIHRAHHVNKDLFTSKGFQSGAVYGTLMMLSKFIEEEQPNYMAICYDAQDGRSLRRETIYPDYKNNRDKVNTISAQEMVVRRIIELMGMYSIARPGYEADDLIGALANSLKDRFEVVVLTGDKDMLQLQGDGITIHDPMKKITYTRDRVVEKFGVEPNQISDYLAIVGDKADNIPGVPGIGPKGAQALLKQFGSVGDIIANVGSISRPYADKLSKSGVEMLEMSHTLSKLWTPPNLCVSSEDVSFNPVYTTELDQLLEKLEFSQNTKDRVKRAIKYYGYEWTTGNT